MKASGLPSGPLHRTEPVYSWPSGVHWLTSIETYADRDGDGDIGNDERVKRYDLRYNLNAAKCDAEYAPRRQLWTIQEKSYYRGTQNVAYKPPVTFEYGSLVPEWEESTISLPFAINTTYGGYSRFGSASGSEYRVSQLIDMDGDGLKDYMAMDSHEAMPLHNSDFRVPNCRAFWLKNMGGTFESMGQARYINLPTIPWPAKFNEEDNVAKAWVNLTGQFVNGALIRVVNRGKTYGGHRLNYNWMDYDYDGDTDLLVQARTSENFEDYNTVYPETDFQSNTGTDFYGTKTNYDDYPRADDDGFLWYVYENNNGIMDETAPQDL